MNIRKNILVFHADAKLAVLFQMRLNFYWDNK